MIWGMRNIPMLEYGRVDLPSVYQVATIHMIHMPKLLEQVKLIFAQDQGTKP